MPASDPWTTTPAATVTTRHPTTPAAKATAAVSYPAAVSERSAMVLARTPRGATVLAVHPLAFYLRIDRSWPDPGLLPVVAPGGLRLPNSVVLGSAPPQVGWGVQPGDRVVVGDGEVRLPGATIRRARVWRPVRVPTVDQLPGARVTGVLERLASSQWVAPARHLANAALRGDALSDAVGHTVGAGQGLTPSGDDVLCGLLLALRLAGADDARRCLWSSIRPRLGVHDHRLRGAARGGRRRVCRARRHPAGHGVGGRSRRRAHRAHRAHRALRARRARRARGGRGGPGGPGHRAQLGCRPARWSLRWAGRGAGVAPGRGRARAAYLCPATILEHPHRSDPVTDLVELRTGIYVDSVSLMQVSRQVAAAAGVQAAQVAMATELNLDVLARDGVRGAREASPNDLVVALRAADESGVAAGRAAVDDALAALRSAGASAAGLRRGAAPTDAGPGHRRGRGKPRARVRPGSSRSGRGVRRDRPRGQR